MNKEHKLQAKCVSLFSDQYPNKRGRLFSTFQETTSKAQGSQMLALGLVPGVSDLTLNRRWAEQPETRTVTEIKQGFDSPELAVSMPPKGGNPDLTDSDLLKIVHYMKSEFIEPN